MANLPPELWRIILGFAESLNISPQSYCSYLNFPGIDLYLRFPHDYSAPRSPWICSLRYVCRTFNAILEPRPFFYINLNIKDLNIPSNARAIYASPYGDSLASLQRLLLEPPKCSQIVMLDLPRCDQSTSNPSTPFGLLCKHANTFSSVRSLTLGFTDRVFKIQDLWTRIHSSFPELDCLVISGEIPWSLPHPVVFKNLEILDLKHVPLRLQIHFPAIRHASFGHMGRKSMAMFGDLPQLESLLVQGRNYDTEIQWELFPNLRLLGLPGRKMDLVPHLPVDHPLRHLHVYVGTIPRDDHNGYPNREAEQSTWIKQIIERLPTITRLSLAFDKRENWLVNWINGEFSEEDCELLDLNMDYGYKSRGSPKGIVYRRTGNRPHAPESDGPSGHESEKRTKGLRAKWDKFYNSTFHKMHL